MFWEKKTSASHASRYFIFLQIQIRDQKSKALMIPYVQKIRFLKTNCEIFFKNLIFTKKNVNGTEVENAQLAQIAAVLLESGVEQSTLLPRGRLVEQSFVDRPC